MGLPFAVSLYIVYIVYIAGLNEPFPPLGGKGHSIAFGYMSARYQSSMFHISESQPLMSTPPSELEKADEAEER